MKAISLFSGAGGDTLGMEQAGVNVIAFSEFNSSCIETHLKNFPDCEAIKGDIRKVPDSVWSKFEGTIDMVFAGFPCQGFSKAGKKQDDDPRNRLFWEFVRVVRLVQPRWIMGENVIGLLSRNTDDGESKVIDVIQGAFREIGYSLSYRVYDTSTLGIPQRRKRLVMIGNRDQTPFTFPDPPTDEPPRGLRSFIEPTLEGAIETTLELAEPYAFPIAPDVEITGTPHPYLVLKHGANLISRGKRDSAYHAEVLNLDQPSKTIICAYTFQPRLYVGLVKPDGRRYLRCLTVNELKQIQGFPSDYTFCGTTSQQQKQIGNAVPPPLITFLVRAIQSSD